MNVPSQDQTQPEREATQVGGVWSRPHRSVRLTRGSLAALLANKVVADLSAQRWTKQVVVGKGNSWVEAKDDPMTRWETEGGLVSCR